MEDDFRAPPMQPSGTGLSSTQSISSSILGTPSIYHIGAARAPGTNCGRRFQHDILTSDLSSLRPVAIRAEFSVPGAPSLSYVEPSFPVHPPHAAGSSLAPSPSLSIPFARSGMISVGDVWSSSPMLP